MCLSKRNPDTRENPRVHFGSINAATGSICPHCDYHVLLSEREIFLNCCYVCRRYGLLLGRWPNPSEVKNMTIQLTDEQVVRLLFLCAKIGRIQNEVPQPPKGVGMAATADLEIAKSIRQSLEANNDALLELGALLR